MASARNVILGSSVDLHDGLDGSLVAHPPRDVAISVRPARHVLLFSEPGLVSPHRHLHLAECIDFGPGPEVIHSCRWPVLHRGGWIAEMDQLAYPAFSGRLLDPRLQRRLRAPEGREPLLQRLTTMLTMYAHPSCKALVFNTRHALDTACRQLSELDAGQLGEAVLKKAVVIYPGQKASPREQVERKWRATAERRVVFCGRDYEIRNGEYALRIFRQLASRMPHVRFTYIGELPSSVDRGAALPNLELLGIVPRRQVLATFADSHILFHPSRMESLGIALFEAAAAGMTVVTATGPSMAHMREIFDERGAVLLDRTVVGEAQEPAEFLRHLERLLTAPGVAASMGLHNHARHSSTPLSLEHRQSRLSALYAEAEATASAPLTIEMAPYFAADRVVSLAAREVFDDQAAYLRDLGIESPYVTIVV